MRTVTVAWTQNKQPIACSPTMTDEKQIRAYLQNVGILKRETMPDTFIDINDLEWVTTKIIKKHADGPEETHPWLYELDLFRPLADWDVFSYWEKERLASMQQHIKQGDLVFDIGAEQGWMSALISKYMSDHIVLFEPTSEFWPGIKAIYERNQLKIPYRCWQGFATNKSNAADVYYGWPPEAKNTNDVIEKRKYRNLYDAADTKTIKSITIDNFVDPSPGLDYHSAPDHITIDVEGAELQVLRGAEQTLKKYRPLVWVSIHPDMLVRDYGQSKEDVLFFMDEMGYDAELLAVDHEHHVFFKPKK